MVIQPCVGRVVWYYPPGRNATQQPQAAIVAHVWSDFLVNLAVFDSNGQTYSKTSVPLVQEGDTFPVAGDCCTWMPYQISQAKKHAEASGVAGG